VLLHGAVRTFPPQPSSRGCWPGPFLKQGIGAILRLAIRSIGRCTRKRPVGNYSYNRTASPYSTRLVEQLTFVADGTTGPFRRVFLQWRRRIRKNAMHMLKMLKCCAESLFSCLERSRHLNFRSVTRSNCRSRGISVAIACPTGQPTQ
jgi:hypothetical protein